MRKEELDFLLSIYYDGLTTAEEESILKDFFSRPDILPGYEAEKAIFGYISDYQDVPAPSRNFESRILSSLDNNPPVKTRRVWKLMPVISGVAAGIVILTSTWFFLRSNEPLDTFADPKVAYAETMKILMEVSVKMNKGAEALNPVSKMNLPDAPGLEVLARSRETIENNLTNLEYVTRAIGITEELDEMKNN